ncbi:MAG TPA: hypothetical protein VGL23_20600 [Chloroflexota bacterium]
MAHTRSIQISELEAWAIEDMIRHTWADEGRPVGKVLLLKIFALVHEFEQRRADDAPPNELPLVLAEDELWAIDFHIRRGHLDPSGVRVGKELLLKVFARLLAIRNAEEMKRLRFTETSEAENPEHERRLRELREQLRRADEGRLEDSTEP